MEGVDRTHLLQGVDLDRQLDHDTKVPTPAPQRLQQLLVRIDTLPLVVNNPRPHNLVDPQPKRRHNSPIPALHRPPRKTHRRPRGRRRHELLPRQLLQQRHAEHPAADRRRLLVRRDLDVRNVAHVDAQRAGDLRAAVELVVAGAHDEGRVGRNAVGY